MWVWMIVTAEAAPLCEQAISRQTFAQSMQTAQEAFERQESEPFRAALTTVQSQAVCVEGILTPAEVASIHRLRGLLAFLDKSYADAESSFAASRRALPDYQFPTALVPDNHPIRKRYEAMGLDDAKVETLDAPTRGFVLLDGNQALERDPRLPVFFQRMDSHGNVQQAYLWEPFGEAPAYRSGKPFPWLLASGVVGVAAGGGLYAGALMTKSSYDDAVSEGEVDRQARLINTNRTLVLSAGAVTGVGIGLITGHLLNGRF